MSKSATLASNPDSAIARPKRARKPRAPNDGPSDSLTLAPNGAPSGGFPTKPLLVGVGIGAALALTAVALGSRPAKPGYFGSRQTTVAGAFTNTALALLARIVARKALAAAANQGARKLASAWPL
ncbi:MAG: hypothetical protein WDO74_10380 [Pseudomonadota bacterium]